MSTRETKQRDRYQEDISARAGITAYLTWPFVWASISALTAWFVAEKILPANYSTWGGAGGVMLIINIFQKPVYEIILDKFITGPGCVGGLITYGLGVIICGILLWKGGLEGLMIGLLLVPFFSFGIALIITKVGPDSAGYERGRRKPRRR